MLRRRITLAIALAGDAAKAPTEIRLFAAGWIDTTKGMFLFDSDSAEAVIKAAKDWGNRYSFDYQHAIIDDKVKPEDKKGAGSFVVETRDSPAGPELWAVDIQWAAGVAEAIEGKEWLYYSPLFLYEESSRRIVEIINCALTNDPATKHMPMLMAASRHCALGSMSHEDVRAKLQSAIGAKIPETDTEWNYIVAVYDSQCVFQRGGKFWRVDYSIVGSALTITSDPVEVQQAFEPVTPAQLNRQQATTTSISQPHVAAKENGLMDKAFLAALGLAETAPETEALAKLTRLTANMGELCKLTGKDTADEALGVVGGWKSHAEQLPVAQAKIAELANAGRKAEVEKILDGATTKVTPAMKPSLLSARPFDRDEDVAWLKAHVEALPTITQLSGAPAAKPDTNISSDPAAAAIAGRKWEELSALEKHNLYFSNKATYDALKADHAARQGK